MSRDSDAEDFEEDLEIDDLDDGGDHSALVGFVAGLLVGGVLGAGVMLFSAPERGLVTRRRVRRRLEDLSDDATDELSKQRRRIQKRLKKGLKR